MEVSNRWHRLISSSVIVVAIAMIIYQLLYTQVHLWDLQKHRIIHLGFALVLISLVNFRKSWQGWPLKLLLLVASVGATLYFTIQYQTLAKLEAFIPATAIAVGILVAILVLIVSWQEFGKVFPILAIISVGYMFFGRYIPGPLSAPPVQFQHILTWIGGNVAGESGVYGSILSLSANYLFLFILFGAFLQAFGGLKFMTAGNDPLAKEQAKQIMMAAIVGLIIVTVAQPVIQTIAGP